MYNIETLSKLTGLPRRTIRYYVQRGLLDPPQGGGRGAYYTEEHLEQTKKIQRWAEQGMPLIHIKAMLQGIERPVHIDLESGIQTVACERFALSDGIELLFRPGRLESDDLIQVRDLVQNLLRRKSNDND